MNSSKLWMRVTSEGTARHAVPTSRGALLCSARRAAAQRTTVRMYTSLRSVEVIAEVIGVLPPEGGPILQKLVKAVKEDVEEAQQEAQQRVEKAEQRVEKAEQRVEEAEQRVEKAEQRVEKAQQRVEKAEQQRQQAEQSKDEAVAVIIREKGAKMVLADKLHLRDKLLSRAMHSAGVRDGRSCLGTSGRPTTVGNRPAASTAVIVLLLRTWFTDGTLALDAPAATRSGPRPQSTWRTSSASPSGSASRAGPRSWSSGPT